jgi:hypothetical protein
MGTPNSIIILYNTSLLTAGTITYLKMEARLAALRNIIVKKQVDCFTRHWL